MKEGTRLRLGDLYSLRTNHQEARQQPLPCLLKIRCLKKRERKKKRETKVKVQSATSVDWLVNPSSGNWNSERRKGVFSDPFCSRKHLGWKGVPLVNRAAFYRAFV
ncbi:hypothetical protein AVEN_11946-1 [Araneus ventricosus]|uniref:Uncharacterized protein n=1 Tax=Araneus ventricosus TaxID=182803 RepID=A0A4Y2L5R7_ARAVE|nr:hypothetical protein AVEN_11946-1 [Araneus ventricosus]